MQLQLDDIGIDYFTRRPALIEAVTLDDARRVAKRLLDGGLLVTVVGRPAGLISTSAEPLNPVSREAECADASGCREWPLPDFADAPIRATLAAMIRVNAQISIDEREIEESFVRASGPGGQNVNKLATAVQLRFDVRGSPSLPAEVRARLERLAGARLTRDGVLVIIAQRHRTQARNRRMRSSGSSISSAARQLCRSSGGRPGRPKRRASAASKARSAAPASSICAASSRRSIDSRRLVERSEIRMRAS